MHSLPPAGFPHFSELPGTPGRPAGPATPTPAPDRLELTRSPSDPGLVKRQPLTSSVPLTPRSPRPWPPSPADLPRSSALAALNDRVQDALLGGLVHWARGTRDEEWRARPTPDGWSVPKNPSRSPVSSRDPFEIPEGTDDLGALRVVSSCSGRLRALRLQWPEEYQDPAYTAQKAVVEDLLRELPADVQLHVVAEGLGKAAVPRHERIHLHCLQLRSTSEVLVEPMTMWARDAALLLVGQGLRVLALPRCFRGDGKVEPRLNRLILQATAAAPASLARELPDVVVRRTNLCFEGGDIVANRQSALVGADSVNRTMAETGRSRAEVVEEFARVLGVEVLVVDPQPDFHVDLGFTWLDDRTVAVADPQLGMELVKGLPAMEDVVQATLSKNLGARYATSARWLEQLGYRVVRLPALAGRGLITPYYTYNNVLIEQYAQVKRVYMPTYGVDVLDGAAADVFRGFGFEIREMPSARHSTRLWGAIRCATGELAWEPG